MKLVLLMLVSVFAMAAEKPVESAKPKEPQIWHLSKPQELCSYNADTKKAKCEKDVSPEAVAEQMFEQLMNTAASCEQRIKALQPKAKK